VPVLRDRASHAFALRAPRLQNGLTFVDA